MTTSRDRRDESGAVLILALVLLFAVSIVVVGLSNIATGSLLTSTNLKSLRTTDADAETATTVAIDWVRYHYSYNTGTPDLYVGQPVACLPAGVSLSSSNPQVTATNPVSVYCIATSNPFGAATRVVQFDACGSGVSASACTGSAVILSATVDFDDENALGDVDCTPSSTLSCGAGETIAAWDLIGADH